MKHLLSVATLILSLGGAGIALAQATGEGEIRKVDRETGRVTIKHGPIEAMDMPPMTMVFRIKDPALFDNAKEGAAIRFTVVKEGGAMVLTSIEPK